MRGVKREAKRQNGRSLACSKCPLKGSCLPSIHKICSDSFVEGFIKGVKFAEKKLKQQIKV